MGMSAETIKQLIIEAIPDADVQIQDLAGDNEHYSIVVISPVFEGKSRVAQHKLVFDAFKGGMGTDLHALSVTTRTPQL